MPKDAGGEMAAHAAGNDAANLHWAINSRTLMQDEAPQEACVAVSVGLARVFERPPVLRERRE